MTDRKPFPSEVQDRFMLRLPDGMRERLKAKAEANKRSMNAEIVAHLEESLAFGNKELAPRVSDLADLIVKQLVERIKIIRDEADAEVKVLQKENRALREAAKRAK